MAKSLLVVLYSAVSVYFLIAGYGSYLKQDLLGVLADTGIILIFISLIISAIEKEPKDGNS